MRSSQPTPALRRRRLQLALLLALLLPALALSPGCGGGGGGSSPANSNNADSGTPVGTLSGYVYVPAEAVLAPGRGLASLPAPRDASTAEAAFTPPPAAPIFLAQRAAPAGFIPLAGAVVQLSGTTKATITTTAGYFSFTITTTDRITGFAKVSVTKPEANITLQFETAVTQGMNKTVQIELSTQTGTTIVKELAGGAPDASFVWVSGRVTTNLGTSLSGVAMTATLVSDSTVSRFTVTDSGGAYSFVGMTDGTWRIVASKAGFRTGEQTVNVSSEYTLTNITFALSGTFDIYDILATRLTENSVTFEFMTSVPAVAQVEFGLTPSFGSNTPFELSYVNTHAVQVQNLSRNTEYYYRIKAKDTNDNQVLTQGSTFRTTDGTVQDTNPPEITTYTVTKTHNSFRVVFTLSKISYGRLEYGLSRANMTATTLRGPGTTISILIDNLTPATTYYIDLLGINTFDTNQITRLSLDPIVTDATPDTTPPLVVNARVTELKPTSVKIAWETPGELSDSQVVYDVLPGSAGKAIKDYSRTTPIFDENPLVSFHEVTISGLEMEKTYYARPVSRDPAGNAGTSAAEVAFTTPRPNTAITLSRTGENPPAGAIAVGERFTVLSLKALGSSTESVAITRLVMRNTGTALGSDFDAVRLLRADALPLPATISGGAFVFELAASTIEVAADGEAYFDIEVLMRSSALGKTVLLDLENASRVTAVGRTYGRAVTPANAFPLASESFTVRKAALTLAVAGATTETTLNTGINNISLLSFTLSGLYEDAYVQKIQVWQTGTAQPSDQPYVNVRLYRGTDSLVSAPSGERMDFLSSGSTGLFTVPKGGAVTLSVVTDIPPGAVTGKSIQFLVQVASVTATGRYSFLAAEVGGADALGSKYTLGQSSLTVSRATADPTPQTFVQGDTQKDLFVFALTAGGAEDVNVTSIKITQGGTAGAGEITDFHLSADNQTKGTAAFLSPATTFANPSGLLFVPKGQTKIVTARGNIAATPGKTVQIGIVAAGDVQGRGADTLTTKESTGVVTGSNHIVVGKLQALATASPSGTLVLAGKDIPLFNFQLRSVGEAVTYRRVYIRLIGDTRIVSNLRLTDGVTTYAQPETTNLGYLFNVDGGSASADNATISFSLLGDVAAVASYAGQKVRYYIDHGGAQATGALSLNQFNSINRVDGNELTVTLGSLAISSAPTVVVPQTIVAGTVAAEIVGGLTVTAGAAENIRIARIAVNEINGSLRYGTDLTDLQIFDGAALLAGAVQNGGRYEFHFDPALTIAASAAKTYTLKAKVPSGALAGLAARFGVLTSTANSWSVAGVLSGLALTPSGSALSNPFTVRIGAMQALPHSSNPPEAFYPKNTAADVEFLRFKVAVDSAEGIVLTRARFTRTSTRILDAASFALRLYDANGVQTQYGWSGAGKVVVEGPNIEFRLDSPALSLPAGTTDVELRVYAKFDTAAVVPGDYESVNLAVSTSLDPAAAATSAGLVGTSLLSQRTVVASGTITGNAMRVQDVADTTAPVISGNAASGITQTGAILAWTTSEPASSQVFHRKNLSGDDWTATGEFSTGTRVTAHSVTLTGLAPGTVYDYKVRSVDAAGNASESSGLHTFTTLAVLTGKLTAAIAADSPGAATVPANTTQTFLKFTLAAASDATNDEDVRVSSIAFTLSGSAVAADFGTVTLTDGRVAYTGTVSGTKVSFASATPGLPLYTIRRRDSLGNLASTAFTLTAGTGTSISGKTAAFGIAAASDIACTGALSGATLTPVGTPIAGATLTFQSGTVVLTQSAAPVTGTIILPGRANYDLLAFVLTPGAQERVDLTKVTVGVTGLNSAALGTDLVNLRLMTGTTTLASGTVVGSTIVFGKSSPLRRLDAGTAVTFTVRVDFSAGATAGRTAQLVLQPGGVEGLGVATGIQIVATGPTPPDGANATDPHVTGSGVTIGTSTLAAVLRSDSPASQSFRPGNAVGVPFARFDLQVGSAESLTNQLLLFSFDGTAADATDLQNVKVQAGATQYALSYQVGPPAGYATNAAIPLPANSTVALTVTGDVIGSNGGRNFRLEMAPGAVSALGTVTGTRLSTGTATAARHYVIGDVVVATDAQLPVQGSADYIAGSPAVVPFWSGRITANNENAKINALSFAFTGSTANLSGLYLRDRTNNRSYTGPSFANGAYSFDTQAATPGAMTITAGNSVDLTLYATLPAAAAVGATVRFTLPASGVTAKGATSDNSLAVSGDAAGNALEIRRGALSVALDADSPVTPDGILIGGTDLAETWFRLTATAVEGLTLRTLAVRESASSRDPQDIRNVALHFGADPLPAAGTTTRTYDAATRTYTFANIQSSAGAAVTIATGETLLVKVRAEAGSEVAPGKLTRFRVNEGGIAVRGAASGASLAAGATNLVSTGSAEGKGQSFVAGKMLVQTDLSGTLNPSFQADFNDFVEIGSTGVKLFRFTLRGGDAASSSLEDITVTAIKVKIAAGANLLDSISLYDDATPTPNLLKTMVPTSDEPVFDALSFALVKGTARAFTVTGNIKTTATPDAQIGMKIDAAAAVSGTGVTSGKAVASSGTAIYYTYYLKRRTLTVSAPAVQVGGVTEWRPGEERDAFAFRLTAGAYESLTNLQVKVTRTGTLADSRLDAALYDGTVKIAPPAPATHQTFSAGIVTFEPGSAYTLSAGATRTFTVKAKPALTAEDARTFALAIAASGDVAAAGTASAGRPVASAGTTAGEAHTLKRTGMSVTRNPGTAPGNASLYKDVVFEALRLDFATDGTNMDPVMLTKLEPTNVGATIDTNLKWEFQGLYEADGTTLLAAAGAGQWDCQGGAPTWNISGGVQIAPAGVATVKTVVIKLKAKTTALAADQIQVEVAAANLVAQVDGSPIVVSGTATGNTFRVKNAAVAFTALNSELPRGYLGATGKDYYLVGNTPGGDKYVCGVYRLTNDTQENVSVTQLRFTFTGTAVSGTEFNNLRVYRLGNNNGTDQVSLTGSVVTNASNILVSSGAVVSGGIVTVTLNPQTIVLGANAVFAILADFPATGGKSSSLTFTLSGLTATGATSGATVPPPAAASGPTINIIKSLRAVTLNPSHTNAVGNTPAAFTAQIPFGGADNYRYRVLRFKLENLGEDAATITTGQLTHTGGAPITDLYEGPNPIDVVVYTAAGAELVADTDGTVAGNAINFNFGGGFPIPAGSFVEILARCYVQNSGVAGNTVVFNVPQSGFTGADTASETLTSYSDGEVKSATHTLGDGLLVANTGGANATIEAYLNGANKTNVFNFTVQNRGQDAVNMNGVTVGADGAGSPRFVNDFSAAAGELWRTGWLVVGSAPEQSVNGSSAGVPNTWTFPAPAPAVSVTPGASTTCKFYAKRHEFRWGAASAQPANWPTDASWPYQGVWPPDCTGTWGARFFDYYPDEGFETGVNKLESPDPNRTVQFGVLDNFALGTHAAPDAKNFRSDGTANSSEFNFANSGTKEVAATP